MIEDEELSVGFFWRELYKEKYSWFFLFVSCLKITLKWKDCIEHRAAMKQTSLLVLFLSCKRFVPHCLLEYPSSWDSLRAQTEQKWSWEIIWPSDLCNQQQRRTAVLVWHGFRWFGNVNETSNLSSLYFFQLGLFSLALSLVLHIRQLCSWTGNAFCSFAVVLFCTLERWETVFISNTPSAKEWVN